MNLYYTVNQCYSLGIIKDIQGFESARNESESGLVLTDFNKKDPLLRVFPE